MIYRKCKSNNIMYGIAKWNGRPARAERSECHSERIFRHFGMIYRKCKSNNIMCSIAKWNGRPARAERSERHSGRIFRHFGMIYEFTFFLQLQKN